MFDPGIGDFVVPCKVKFFQLGHFLQAFQVSIDQFRVSKVEKSHVDKEVIAKKTSQPCRTGRLYSLFYVARRIHLIIIEDDATTQLN